MKPVLIVLGSAAGFQKEAGGAAKLCLDGFDVMAINASGCEYLKPIQYWFTQHPEKFGQPHESFGYLKWNDFFARRKGGGGNQDFEAHSTIGIKGLIDRSWQLEEKEIKGSSTLAGVIVGQRLGYNKIIVCGTPLDDGYEHFQAAWNNLVLFDDCLANVRATAGFTRNLLGQPTREWINEN